MSFKVEINDPKITIEEECTQKVEFRTDIPLDSSARTKDVGVTMIITGKILSDSAEVGKPADSTSKLLEWSKVPAEQKEAYKNVVVTVKSGGISTRKYELPNAFVVDYFEDFSNQEGGGVFTLVLKQRKNKLKDVKVTGGFAE
ncbi:MAG: membrane-associated protease 1 [Selenomonadaceae bacterium]|nr:membrane-associated protease 1 [Selenomonadaceae bacterium]MBP3723429.1 membrane-associated protease 1 [Selenomonadaceae bacterium]